MENHLINTAALPVNDYKVIIAAEDGIAKHFLEVRTHLMEKYFITNPGTSIPQFILAHFKQLESNEERLVNRLRIIAKGNAPVKIELKDFGSFPFHTIYVKVSVKEPLEQLVKKLRKDGQRLMKFDNNKPGFMSAPHLTLARKLSVDQFNNIWREYSHKHFTGKFVAHKMILLRKRETESRFSPIESFGFENLPIEIKQGILF